MPDEPTDIIAQARQFLLSHRHGTLIADESPRKIRFILDLDRGCPAAPIAQHELFADSLALMVPDEGEDALQLLVAAEELDPTRDRCADRWQANFGRADQRRWARFTIESARFATAVLDGDSFAWTSPLAAHQTALCRTANADPTRLAQICRAGSEATAVGVDEWGLDVRTRIGVLRVSFATLAGDVEAAREAIARLLRGEADS